MTTATRPSLTAFLSSLMRHDEDSLGPVLLAAEREFSRLVATGIDTDEVHARASTLARHIHGKNYRQCLTETAGADNEDAGLLLRSWDAEAAFALGLIAGLVLAGGGGR